MQEVAVGNYRAFIAAADALLAIREEVSSIDKHLESLVFYAYLLDVNTAGVNVGCCLVFSLCFLFGCILLQIKIWTLGS